jgi:hypothetical protein
MTEPPPPLEPTDPPHAFVPGVLFPDPDDEDEIDWTQVARS